MHSITFIKGGIITTNTKQTKTDKAANRQRWVTLIKQWEESKLSQQTYCTQLGINLNSFTYWRGKFVSSASREVKSKFVRVKTASNYTAATDVPRSIQIKLLTGHVVYIPTNLDV